MSGAQNLANLGQQQLGAQQGIYNLQNTTGAQQQALEQQKINQGIQDYSNAQQYPLMQLGTMSNMLRGLPMQAQTTQQYVAAPNNVTQAIGAAGAGASLYNALKGAEGGLPKEFKKSGIMSYDVGGEVESDLYNMDESSLQRQLKESSSPSVKRMAQRILRERQLEKQPQQPQPSYAGGGIIAFEKGGGAKLKPEDVVGPEDNSQARQAAGILLAPRDSGAVSRNPVTPDIDASGVMPKLPAPREDAIAAANNVQPAKQPPNSLEAAMSDPNIPDVMKGQLADIQTKYARTTDDIIKEKRAAYEAAGVSPRNPEERANLMKERANADDEAKRNRYLQAAAFFARWGSTPGSTLAAGLTAVRERVPEIIESEKEAKKIRMEINKSIASLDEATRLENKGEVDAATAIKEKDAEKMQAVYFKLSDIEMAAKKEDARLQRQREEDLAKEKRGEAHDVRIEGMRKSLTDSQNATQLQIETMRNKSEQARIAASNAQHQDQAKWHDYQRMSNTAANELGKLDALRSADDYKKSKEYITKAEALRDISADKTIPPMYQSGYEKAVANINRVEQDIQTRRGRIDRQMKEYETRTFGKPFEFNTDTTPANRPQVKGNAARGGESRPSLNDPSLQK
jgi:soluble cytochrome b562